jgi:hypothetical protein
VRHILGEDDEGSVAVGLVAPQLDVSLLLPAVSQSRDSVGGEMSLDETAHTVTSVYSAGDLLLPPHHPSKRPIDTMSTTDEEHTLSPSVMTDDEEEEDENEPAAKGERYLPAIEPMRTANVLSQSVPVTSTPLGPVSAAGHAPANVFSTPQKQRPVPSPTPSPAHFLPLTGALRPPSAPSSTKKNSLTSSLSNMMASLESLSRGNTGSASAASLPPVPVDDDNISIRSDNSSDSENYVLISQVRM